MGGWLSSIAIQRTCLAHRAPALPQVPSLKSLGVVLPERPWNDPSPCGVHDRLLLASALDAASARQGKFSCQEDRQIIGRQADRRDLPGSQPNLANKFQCEGLVALLGVEVVELVQPNLLL